MSGDLASGDRRLSSLAAQIHAAQRQISLATITSGRNLVLARRLMGQRDFSDWISDQWGWADPTAQQLVDVADRFGAAELADVVEHFAPGALLALSPPFASSAAAAAIAEARKGRRIGYAEALDLVAKHCPEAEAE